MKTLLDVTSRLLNVTCLEGEVRGEKNPTLVILPSKLVLIHAVTGVEIASYAISCGDKAEVLDCIYCKGSRIFLVSVSNSSIISIPETAFDSVEYSTFKHSVPIKKLLRTSESRVYGCCEHGGIYRFEVNNGIVSGVIDSRLPVKGSRFISAEPCGGSIAVLQCELSGKKKTASGGGAKKYYLDINDSADLSCVEEEGHCRLDITGVADESGSSDPSIHLVANGRSQSYSVLYHSTDGSMKWLKIGPHGAVLFERCFELKTGERFPNAVFGTSSSLWVFSLCSGLSCAEVWQSRYGIRPRDMLGDAAVVAVPGYHSDDLLPRSGTGGGTSSPAGIVLVLRDGGPGAVDVLTASTCMSRTDTDAPTYTLSQLTIHSSQYPFIADTVQDIQAGAGSTPANGLWSLGSMVGALRRTREAEHDADVRFAPAKRTRKGSTSKPGILGLLTAETQEILQGIVTAEESSSDRELSHAREDAAMAFLRVAQQMSSLGSGEQWGNEDWSLFEGLLSRGYVALSMYPHLFGAILHAGRSELLVAVARDSIDLTEKQCVRLIMAGAVTVTSHGPSDAATTSKVGSRSTKKSKHSSAGEGDALSMFRRVVFTIMRRRGGLDASVLGETLRSLPMSAAAVLLKTLSMSLRGTCSSAAEQDESVLEINDIALQNALTWIEALLEAQFHAIVLGLSDPAHCMNSAVETLLEATRGIDPAVDLTESALGLCTHIYRMNKHNGYGSGAVAAQDSQLWNSEGSSSMYQLSIVRF